MKEASRLFPWISYLRTAQQVWKNTIEKQSGPVALSPIIASDPLLQMLFLTIQPFYD